jgi:uncharacterized protein
MVNPDLLDILVCPDTKEPVRLADAGFLARVNEAVSSGKLRTRGGEPVREPLDEALVREDGRVLYPVRDGIPVMLIDESMLLDPLS